MDTSALRPLDLDWYGQSVPGAPRWRLALEGEDLLLRGAVDRTPIRVPQDRPGAFAEGLWLGDVVEAFLVHPATGWYLELNLGPFGAWWACGHTAPRIRQGPLRLDGGRTRMVAADDHWDTTLRIPVASLPQELAFDPGTTRANVTFCLGTPQQFLTVADLGDGAPDFHRPDRFLPLGELLG